MNVKKNTASEVNNYLSVLGILKINGSELCLCTYIISSIRNHFSQCPNSHYIRTLFAKVKLLEKNNGLVGILWPFPVLTCSCILYTFCKPLGTILLLTYLCSIFGESLSQLIVSLNFIVKPTIQNAFEI